MEYLIRRLPSRKKSIQLFTSIEQNVLCPAFIKKYECQRYVHQYSWVCFHTWIILNKLSSNKLQLLDAQNIWLHRNLKICFEEFTREFVYNFDENFSLDVYEELRRKRGIIFWSLDDYFEYDFKGKALEQIFVEDFGYYSLAPNNQQLKQDIIQNGCEHITKTYSNFSKMSLHEVLQNKVIWLQQ